MSEFTNEGFNIGYRTGQLAERERIIVLLGYQATWLWDNDQIMASRATKATIDIIKGDNE